MQVCSPDEEDLQCIHFNTIVLLLSDICNPDSYNSLMVVQEQHLLFHVFFLSDGQAVAIKLSGQINKVVKHMNKGLISLNAAMDVSAKPLSFDDIKDPSGNVYGPELTNESSEVPASTKAKLIDLYCLIKRCQEEVIMVREEMARLEAFYNREIEVIDQICMNFGNNSSPHDNGLKSILLTNRARIYLQFKCWEGLYSMSPLNALPPPTKRSIWVLTLLPQCQLKTVIRTMSTLKMFHQRMRILTLMLMLNQTVANNNYLCTQSIR